MVEYVKVVMGTVKRIPLYLSCLVRRSKNLYIFGAWFGEKYADNSRAMFEYTSKSTNKNCVWITRNPQVYQNVKELGYPVEYVNSLKGIFTQLRAKAAFSVTGDGDFNRYLLGNCYHIGLWHGVGGGKTIGLDDKEYCKYALSKKGKYYRKLESYPLRRNYLVCTSEEMRKVFKSAFGISDDHFINAGQPRNDMFYDSEYKMKTISRDFFGGKRIILYMPTHRKTGQVHMDMSKLLELQALDEFCKANDILFVIRKHFYHKNEVENLSRYTNIIDITNVPADANELLMLADYLISDYSSCTADYLILDRPIFYYCYDYAEYISEDRDMYWNFDEIAPGQKANTFIELLEAMKEVIGLGNDTYSEERNRVRLMLYAPECQKKAAGVILGAVDKLVKK